MANSVNLKVFSVIWRSLLSSFPPSHGGSEKVILCINSETLLSETGPLHGSISIQPGDVFNFQVLPGHGFKCFVVIISESLAPWYFLTYR